MSFNGSGVFNINTAGQPVVTGTTISSTAFNALTADLATGLSTTITKDGQSTPTANIPMGGFKITGLGDGTVATDAATYGQITAFGVPGYTTTATAAGTTTLTAASTRNQFFTGTTTQTVVLPVTSTLVLGQQFVITNNSTGVVTVNSSGGNQVVAMVPLSVVTVTCILTSGTTAASWDIQYTGKSAVTGTGSMVLATSPTLVTPNLGTPSALVLTNATGTPSAIGLANGTGLPLTTGVTGTLPIANGGTGQTSATNAFNALSPLTTQGDILYYNGTNNVRLAAGTSGQFLKTLGAGANPAWADAASAGWTFLNSSATTSGSSVTITGIPSTAVAVWVVGTGISMTADNQSIGLQLGDSGGLETNAYAGSCSWVKSTTPAAGQWAAAAMAQAVGGVTDNADDYTVTFLLQLNSQVSNQWVINTGIGGSANGPGNPLGGSGTGRKATSATMDRVALVTGGTFDAGTMYVFYK